MQNAVNELHSIGINANLSRKTIEDIRNLSAINVLEMNMIAQNTAISAYYSAENAYWSRKNAQISNSLGFLIALK